MGRDDLIGNVLQACNLSSKVELTTISVPSKVLCNLRSWSPTRSGAGDLQMDGAGKNHHCIVDGKQYNTYLNEKLTLDSCL